ncbi:MAG TPA: hypothetical protein PKY03_09555 [Moraxellaceae bacterium]|nr:hypothetical protein [Moraxellaceae bacterium]
MNFRERMRIVEVKSAIQTSGMSSELRNSLWNVLDIKIWRRNNFLYHQHGEAEIYGFARDLWFGYFKQPIDTIPSRHSTDVLKAIRKYFFECEWAEVYEFVEFILSRWNIKGLVEAVSDILAKELSGYRIIGNLFVPVTDQSEVDAVQEALNEIPYASVQAHLRQAMSNLSRRESPDYRNSIKESISAVEAMAREMSGNSKATLGDALSVLEKSGELHAALRRGFSAIYGYTSDEGGIRHAMLDEPNIDVSDAKFFFVMCASFINYLRSKSSVVA